jgi:hypothetical protein
MGSMKTGTTESGFSGQTSPPTPLLRPSAIARLGHQSAIGPPFAKAKININHLWQGWEPHRQSSTPHSQVLGFADFWRHFELFGEEKKEPKSLADPVESAHFRANHAESRQITPVFFY